MDRSRLGCRAFAGPLLLLAFALTACSGNAGGFGHHHDDGNGPPTPVDGGSPGVDGARPVPDGAGTSPDSGTIDTGAPDTAVPDAGPGEVGSPDTGVDTGTVVSADGFGPSRAACIDEINKLRATQSLSAYTLVNTAAVNTCIDDQASYDEKADSPHDAWIHNKFPSCNGNAQDECIGYGTDPLGITKCMDAMWAEKDQANCKGCIGCTAFGGACPGCDYYGMHGPECGHYVNMSATYFSMAWCGFAASPGTWSAQNFQ